MKSVTMVFGAYRLGEEPVRNFIAWNKENFEEFGVQVIVVADVDMEIEEEWVTVLVYPEEQEVFSIGKTVNYGIRRAHSDIVVKTDVDIYFSKEVILDVINGVEEGSGMVCICGNANRLEYATKGDMISWGKVKKLVSGRGACFAMSMADWYILCGYNENIAGWGADDDDMWKRADAAIDMTLTHEFPIYHIKHPIRKRNDPDSFFPARTAMNRRIGVTMPWKDENWGMP